MIKNLSLDSTLLTQSYFIFLSPYTLKYNHNKNLHHNLKKILTSNISPITKKQSKFLFVITSKLWIYTIYQLITTQLSL